MIRYKKWTFIQKTEDVSEWTLIESDVGVQEYVAFDPDRKPWRMCILMLRPFGKAFNRHGYMAIDMEKCKKAD